MAASSLHLTLTGAELELLECKLAVIAAIKDEQRKRKLTTEKLAARLGISRARTGALLQGDADFTLDEIAGAFFQLDMSREDFGATFASAVDSGDTIVIQTPGGGGFGAP